MSKRLIDAEELKEKLFELGESFSKSGNITSDMVVDNCITIVNRMPTIEETQDQWISVKDALPKAGEKFIAYTKWGNVSEHTRWCWGDKAYAVGGLDFEKDILFWQPLPQPPKGCGGR